VLYFMSCTNDSFFKDFILHSGNREMTAHFVSCGCELLSHLCTKLSKGISSKFPTIY
jgi:hypothetical protein